MGTAGPDRVAVGLVGLGLMGAPVAARIYRGGHPLTVYNRTASKAERFAAASGGAARVARRPADAAAGSRVVITMVADPAALREVTLGPGGILEGAAAGTTLIDMSTVDPETVRAVGEAAAARGVGMLDAPVTGGVAGAEAGTLTLMVGGEAAVLEACRPILQLLAKTIAHLGPLGMGAAMKLVNNICSTGYLAVAAEALVLGAKVGLDPAQMVEVLLGGSGRSEVLASRAPRVLRGDFSPGFRLKHALKDVGLAVGMAGRANAQVPVTSAVHRVYQSAAAGGQAEHDSSAVFRWLEELNGAAVRARA
ncbi:MAG: NAD(P)-dependent oxidoreductase [candidate division NC10 bacterium]|nr:NAD(P)-dependent oxidoreductase [candidate division NC10 bacterium]